MMNKLSVLIVWSMLCSFSVNCQDWNLVWSDEFSGTTLNSANWTYDVGTGSAQGLTGWGNNELQYYRSGTSNVNVGGGLLTITAKQESFAGSNYTSGRIKSAGLQAWTTGKIEARVKLPITQGIWPAFWMLRDDPFADPNAQFVWPGEIDVVETVGHQPSIVHGTAHYGVPGAVQSSGSSYTLPTGTVADDFHTYTVEWFDDQIVWYFDGIQFHTITTGSIAPAYWLFDQDYHLLMNVAVGGNWPGNPDNSTVFPAEMQVDWVRVYQLTSSTVSTTFNVDMSCETGFSQVTLESPDFGWCGNCVPMSDPDNDGIWSITLDLPTGPFEYKYAVDNFSGQEDLVDDMNNGGNCAPVTDFATYANRQVTITSGSVQNDVYGTCTTCNTNSTPTVTFRVDMSSNPPQAGESVFWNSDQNGWCGTCAEMFDTGNNIYELTVDEGYAAGIWKYVFVTGTAGSNVAEVLDQTQDGACTLTEGAFTNRTVTVGTTNVDMGVVCWESCDATCADPGLGCTDPTASNYSATATTDDGSCKYLITFMVDMNGVPFSFAEAHVNGSFNGWCGACNPLTDADMDGVWEGSIELNLGDYEFLFTADGWTNAEAMTDGSSCTLTTIDGSNTFINRTLSVTGVDTYEAAWEACPVSCPTDITGDGIINIDDFLALNSAFGTTCTGCPSDITGDGIVNIDDFLALNSAFGTTCP